MSTLREKLHDLAGYDVCEDEPRGVVRGNPIHLDGRISRGDEAARAQLDHEVGLVADDLPRNLREELKIAYGAGITERELNLIETGALLSVLVMQQWVRCEPVPDMPE